MYPRTVAVGYLGALWAFIGDGPWKTLMPRVFCSMYDSSLGSGVSVCLPGACSFHQGEQLGLNMVFLPSQPKCGKALTCLAKKACGSLNPFDHRVLGPCGWHFPMRWLFQPVCRGGPVVKQFSWLWAEGVILV